MKASEFGWIACWYFASVACALAAGEPPAGSFPSSLTNVGGTVFFTADDGVHGRELWKSDGTAAGTVMVKDLSPGTRASMIGFPTVVEDTLFFVVFGTRAEEAQTVQPSLWKSDGTEKGTVKVKDLLLGWELAAIKNLLYFVAQDELHGKELWRSDGTEQGTVIVKDIYPGSRGSNPEELTNVDGILFFTALDETDGTQLWKSDGTKAGTQRVARVNQEPYAISGKPRSLTNVQGVLFFRGIGPSERSLWTSDGTEAGTARLADVAPDNNWWSPATPQVVEHKMFFRRQRGDQGGELWKSDGTAEGTIRVKEIHPDDQEWAPDTLTAVNDLLFFRGVNRSHGGELWKSDGTERGTILVKDFCSGGTNVLLHSLVDVEGTLYFTAAANASGAALWKSDGTEIGTTVVKKFPSSKPATPNMPFTMGPLGTVAVGGNVFFVIDDGIHDWELWKSDGTAAGTAMVKDIRIDE